MSDAATEAYLETEVTQAVKVLDEALREYYDNSSYLDGQLSDCISYDSFREGVVDELTDSLAVSRYKTKDKAMKELDHNLEGLQN